MQDNLTSILIKDYLIFFEVRVIYNCTWVGYKLSLDKLGQSLNAINAHVILWYRKAYTPDLVKSSTLPLP